jgi:hypothetical protein
MLFCLDCEHEIMISDDLRFKYGKVGYYAELSISVRYT